MDDATLLSAADQLEATIPAVRDLMNRTRAGQVSPDQFLQELMQIAIDRAQDVSKAMMEPGVPAAEGAMGIPRLNPQYEAMLTEIASMDGDVPQLRTMPLPRDAVPAVPVAVGSVRDVVSVGLMLQQASEEIRREVDSIEALAEAALVPHQEGGLVLREKLPDPVGYERGRLPALRTVDMPAPTAVATMDTSERQGAAWKALSTSQGRRSLAPAIADEVVRRLRELGHDVVGSVEPVSRCGIVVFHRIGVSGPTSTNADFAVVSNTASVIAAKVHSAAEGRLIKGLLCLEPVNNVPQRIFGWRAGVFVQ